MGFNSGLAPDVVQTLLDEVLKQEFEFMVGPHEASVTNSAIFRQRTAENQQVHTELFKGPGLWQQRPELDDVASDTIRVGDRQDFVVVNFANSVDISKNLFDDDMHNTVEEMIRQFGLSARVTRETEGMGTYRLGFTTTLTNDGAALFSNTHTNLNGDTVDNLETGVLTPDNLEAAIVSLRQQVNQAGLTVGYEPACLLVPESLFREAVEVTESVLVSDTADNAVNYVSAKYGIQVKRSPYLGANNTSGSDTAWFLLSRHHSISRWERQGLQTELIDWRLQRNNNYIYKGEYREVYGALSYEGAVGSNGTV